MCKEEYVDRRFLGCVQDKIDAVKHLINKGQIPKEVGAELLLLLATLKIEFTDIILSGPEVFETIEDSMNKYINGLRD